LFYIQNTVVGVLDSEAPRFLPPLETVGATKIEVTASGGSLLAAGPLFMQRYNTQDGMVAVSFGIGFTLLDMALSPKDPDLFAISDDTGSYLRRRAGKLPNGLTQQGDFEFSSDGNTVYFVNSATCALEIYRIETNGLALEQTRTNASCSGFVERDGFLYFNSGLIYDPATGVRVSNLSLTPPSFVVPRENGDIDVLNRTNGNWMVRRLRGSNFELVASRDVAEMAGSPIEMVEAGADQVAIRTATAAAGIYLVGLFDGDELRIRVQLGGNGQLTMSFNSTLGAEYRVERRESVAAGGWTIVRDNIEGTGGNIDEVISGAENGMAFYRVRLVQ
jgi:hypothetical protein